MLINYYLKQLLAAVEQNTFEKIFFADCCSTSLSGNSAANNLGELDYCSTPL